MKKAFYCILGILFLAGCSSQGSGQSTNTSSTEANATVKSTQLPTGDLIKASMLIGNGGAARVPLKTLAAGDIDSVGVQIGNFSGASDGDIVVTLCQGDVCASGKRSLAGTTDNAYAEIKLVGGLQVQSGASVQLKIAKLGGTKDLALWLYKSADAMTAPDGTMVQASPKVEFIYK